MERGMRPLFRVTALVELCVYWGEGMLTCPWLRGLLEMCHVCVLACVSSIDCTHHQPCTRAACAAATSSGVDSCTPSQAAAHVPALRCPFVLSCAARI